MKTLSPYLLIVAVVLSSFLVGCEDPIPVDYTEDVVLEGFVLVGEPLAGIRIYRTLPITDTFRIAEAIITDATCIVKVEGIDIPMTYVRDSFGGTYQAVDTSYRVLPNTTYTVEVGARGKVLTGETHTPPLFSWTTPPPDTLNYPGQALELRRYDSLDVYWEPVPNVERYVLSIQCLDTSAYGSYLTPPTPDSNRRLRKEDRFDDGTLITNERTRFGLAIQASTPTVWAAFKWFGRQELRVYAPDQAFGRWFSMVGFGRRSQYDYRLGNVKGGLGVWGSASFVQARVFLKKDKP